MSCVVCVWRGVVKRLFFLLKNPSNPYICSERKGKCTNFSLPEVELYR